MPNGQRVGERIVDVQDLTAACRQVRDGDSLEAERIWQQSVSANQCGNGPFFYWRALLGLLLHQYNQAQKDIQASLSLGPATAASFALQGHICRSQGLHRDASAAYESALALDPNQPDWHYNLALNLQDAGQDDRAAAAYRQVLALAPRHAAALNNMALLAQRHGGLDESVSLWQRALSADPQLLSARLNLALALIQQQDFESAEPHLHACLALQPGHVSSTAALAALYMATMRHAQALELYRKLESVDSTETLPFLLGHSLHSALQVADWHGLDQRLDRLVQGIDKGSAVCTPFACLALLDDPARHAKVAARYARQIDEAQRRANSTVGAAQSIELAAIAQAQAQRASKGVPIRVGYFSSDFHEHATAYLIAQLIEMHDPSIFEISLFSYGKTTRDPMQQRLSQGKARWVACSKLSDGQIVAMARSMAIDIAVDLKGYTFAARPAIFAQRCAPIQIAYLGYPGTLGTDTMDYLIADRVVLPNDEAMSHYTEAIIRLPVCYQVNDKAWDEAGRQEALHGITCDRANRRMQRVTFGLDPDAIVYGSFNNTYKILPEVYEDWLRVLHEVPRSQLWLLADNQWAAEQLKAQAAHRGIDPARLVFSPRLDRQAHLARQALADVFLDTFPYNAHTTASDALRRGTLVLTRCGRAFAGRVAASLLTSLGLTELIVESRSDYCDVAARLGQDADFRNDLQDRLQRALKQTALFSAQGVLPWIEAGYVEVVRRYQAQQLPSDFDVDEPMLQARHAWAKR